MLSLAIASVLAIAAPKANATPVNVVGGQAELLPDFANVAALYAKNIAVYPISPAALNGITLRVEFPITGGTVDDQSMLGTVNLAGGLWIIKYTDSSFSEIENSVQTTNLRIVNGNTLVGDTMGLIPAPSADLTNTTINVDGNGNIDYTAEAIVPALTALVLNTYFNTDAFVGGSRLGALSAHILTQPLLGDTGNIVVRKDAVPDDPQDFTFTPGGGLTPIPFQLDDDSDPTLSNTRSFVGVAVGSGYSIAETEPAGWYQGAATCDDGSPPTNISVSADETVTCTFTNARNYPRPGGGSPLRAPLVPEFEQCTAPDATHASPLEVGSCTSPDLESSELATGSTGQGSGSARLEVMPGSVGTTEDEADVAIVVSAGDVRKQSDGTDYTGNVILESVLRITDRANGTAGVASATASDLPFALGLPCMATPGPEGATCSISTTADSLVPGTVKEGIRAVVKVESLVLKDLGPNGTGAEPDCEPDCGDGDENVFLRQGVFTP